MNIGLMLMSASGAVTSIPSAFSSGLAGAAFFISFVICAFGLGLGGPIWMINSSDNYSKKEKGWICLTNFLLIAVVTISSLVYSPGVIVPDNAWGGIVVGVWVGGGLSLIFWILDYFTS